MPFLRYYYDVAIQRAAANGDIAITADLIYGAKLGLPNYQRPETGAELLVHYFGPGKGGIAVLSPATGTGTIYTSLPADLLAQVKERRSEESIVALLRHQGFEVDGWSQLRTMWHDYLYGVN